MFLQVSVILSTGGRDSTSMVGLHAWGVCIRGIYIGGGWGLIRPSIRYYRIRWMSGRYASYWNAFLFNLFSCWVVCSFRFRWRKTICEAKHWLLGQICIQICTISENCVNSLCDMRLGYKISNISGLHNISPWNFKWYSETLYIFNF